MSRVMQALVVVGFVASTAVAIGTPELPGVVSGSGPAEERTAVVQVLRDYLRVTDARDKAAIQLSFHPSALLNSVTASGIVRSMTQDEWWERVSRIPANTPARKSSITLVEVANVAAVARIDITDARGNASSDLFTLQKTKDGWRIVNKVLSVPL
jgi:Putative lumazine-binding